MPDLAEFTDWLDADSLGGRVSCNELRVVGFELSQLTHETIVLGVRNNRII